MVGVALCKQFATLGQCAQGDGCAFCTLLGKLCAGGYIDLQLGQAMRSAGGASPAAQRVEDLQLPRGGVEGTGRPAVSGWQLDGADGGGGTGHLFVEGRDRADDWPAAPCQLQGSLHADPPPI